MKFSVSECLPLNVIGFSYLILGLYDGYYTGYYVCEVLGPASATGYYMY
jgi:hypothetical protein